MANAYDELKAKFVGEDIWEIYKGFPNYGDDQLGQSDDQDTKRIEHAILFSAEVLRVTIAKAADKICAAIKANE